jgi:hypothetical protein
VITLDALISGSTSVVNVICRGPHPELNWPEALIATVYRKRDFDLYDPYRYFLGPGNNEQVYRRTKPVTHISRVWLAGQPVLLGNQRVVDAIAHTGPFASRQLKLNPWQLECLLCAGGTRFSRGAPQRLPVTTTQLAKFTDELLAGGPGPYDVPLTALRSATSR